MIHLLLPKQHGISGVREDQDVLPGQWNPMQLESLLNLAIEALPEDCDKVAWLDCDYLFDSPNWWTKTADLLEQYAVIQPFGYVLRLDNGELPATCPRELRMGFGNGHSLQGIALAHQRMGPMCLRRHPNTYGLPGMAWAGRRSLLLKHRLYYQSIVGSGDIIFAQAALGLVGSHSVAYPRCMQQHIRQWQQAFAAEVQQSVSFTPGVAMHLYHGDMAQRGYVSRHEGLVQSEFDPTKDVTLDKYGVLTWASDKPKLHQFLRDYFDSRAEDD